MIFNLTSTLSFATQRPLFSQNLSTLSYEELEELQLSIQEHLRKRDENTLKEKAAAVSFAKNYLEDLKEIGLNFVESEAKKEIALNEKKRMLQQKLLEKIISNIEKESSEIFDLIEKFDTPEPLTNKEMQSLNIHISMMDFCCKSSVENSIDQGIHTFLEQKEREKFIKIHKLAKSVLENYKQKKNLEKNSHPSVTRQEINLRRLLDTYLKFCGDKKQQCPILELLKELQL